MTTSNETKGGLIPQMRVAGLSIAPVKGMRMQSVSEIHVDKGGARGDRRFLIAGQDGRLVNGKHLGTLVQVIAECPAPHTHLKLRFSDDEIVQGEVELGPPTTVMAYGAARRARSVIGPWSEAISAWAGRKLELVQAEESGDGVDRPDCGAVTLLSRGSLRKLARAAGVSHIDPRRFRMTVVVDGLEPFDEESWIGHEIGVGEVRLRVNGNVGRCAVTTQSHDTGRVDMRTLELLKHLRQGIASTEPLPFGVHASVITPGLVQVDNAVVACMERDYNGGTED